MSIFVKFAIIFSRFKSVPAKYIATYCPWDSHQIHSSCTSMSLWRQINPSLWLSWTVIIPKWVSILWHAACAPRDAKLLEGGVTIPKTNSHKSDVWCTECARRNKFLFLKVLLQWNSTSVYTSWTYSTYHLELALDTFIRQFISACLVCHTSQEKISLNSYSEIHGSRYPMRSNLSSVTAALSRL